MLVATALLLPMVAGGTIVRAEGEAAFHRVASADAIKLCFYTLGLFYGLVDESLAYYGAKGDNSQLFS